MKKFYVIALATVLLCGFSVVLKAQGSVSITSVTPSDTVALEPGDRVTYSVPVQWTYSGPAGDARFLELLVRKISRSP